MDKKGKTEKIIGGIKKLGIVLVFLVIFIALLLFASISWMFKTWTHLTMSELVYHIQSPIAGTDSGIIISYIVSCLLAAVLLLIVVLFLYRMFQEKKVYVLTVSALLCVSAAALAVGGMWSRLDISAYVGSRNTYSTFIDENYVDPKAVNITFPEKKRNLIYIFMESMENTYADKESGGGFSKNVIPELTQLSKDNENFSGGDKKLNGGIALDGTGWTVAAMFAQVSGLPLVISGNQNAMSTQENFFPQLDMMGDILEKEGYQQSLLLGSEAVFGGREQLFTQNGNYNIWDYTYSKEKGEIPPDYKVFWGYEDKKLFESAKQHLLEMSASDQPFNLTMLTVDTHFEDGYWCDDCPDTFSGNQYANVMACSSKKVTEFVEWVQRQPFYEDTTIVISGDHETMDSDFCEDVDEDYQRTVYTTYINAEAQPEKEEKRIYSTFDNFPTTLAGLGVSIEGNRLGLGTNLFSAEPTLLERYDVDTVNLELSKKSKLLENLSASIDQERLDGFLVDDVPEEEAVEEIDLEAEGDTLPPEEIAQPLQMTGDIAVTEYSIEKGKFEVIVGNFSEPENVQAVRCAVWSKEDQSDLKWYEAAPKEGQVFQTSVWASDFGFWEGTYQIHVYAVTGSGEQVEVGSAEGYI